MSEIKRDPIINKREKGPIINNSTRLRFIRKDEVKLSELPDNEFGNDWKPAATFLTKFAEDQIESYPHYAEGRESQEKASLLEELRASHPIDSVSHLLAMEPIALLTNLDTEQLSTVLQGLRHLGIAMDRRDKTRQAELVIQGMLLGRLTAK